MKYCIDSTLVTSGGSLVLICSPLFYIFYSNSLADPEGPIYPQHGATEVSLNDITDPTSEVLAVDPVLLHLNFGRFLLQKNVFGEVPHGSRPSGVLAGVFGSSSSAGQSVCWRRAQAC